MNIIKRIIPTITGIITGIFIWDLESKKGLLECVLISAITALLFNVVWIIYSLVISKKNKKILEMDALTFIPFFVLSLFPIKYFIGFDLKYMQFGSIPPAILLIFSISFFIFLKILFYRGKIKDIKSDGWAYWIMIFYFICFTVLSILKHYSFFSTAYDLAIYDQGIWGLRNFHLTDSIMGFSIIGGHFEPILGVLALCYMIYSSPVTLLILQTAMIALGTIPLYLLAKKVLNNRLIALSISAAYLMNVSIQYANLFDFHPMVLAVPFIFFAFYFLEKRKYGLFVTSLIIAGLTKEYIPLMFLPFGIYLFFVHKKKTFGIITALMGLVWFFLNIAVIIPYFFGNSYLMFHQNPYFGSNLYEFIKTFITRPLYIAKYLFVINKFAFLVLLVVPVTFGIFAFMAPEILILGITEVVIVLLNNPDSLPEITYHHQVLIIPFIITATVYGIRRFKKFANKLKGISRKNVLAATGLLLLSTALLANIFYGPFAILYDLDDFNIKSDYVNAGNELLTMIPKNASVAAPNWILPHLSQRDYAYTLNHFLKRDSDLFEAGELEPPEYILMDLSEAIIDPKRSALNIKNSDLSNLFSKKNYGIFASNGTWILLKKGLDYEQNICKILPYLNKEDFPYISIDLKDDEPIKKCWQKR